MISTFRGQRESIWNVPPTRAGMGYRECGRQAGRRRELSHQLAGEGVGMHLPRRQLRTALIGSLAAGLTVSLTTLGLAVTPSGAATTVTHPLKGAAARQLLRNAYLGSTRNARVLRANTSISGDSAPPANDHQAADGDLADQFDQYYLARTAPAGYVTGDA